MWSRECRGKPSPGRSDQNKSLAVAVAAARCPGKPEQPLPALGNPSCSPRRRPGRPRSKVSGRASLFRRELPFAFICIYLRARVTASCRPDGTAGEGEGCPLAGSARAGRESGAPAGSPGVPRAPGVPLGRGHDRRGGTDPVCSPRLPGSVWGWITEPSPWSALETVACIFVPSELLKGGREWHFVVFCLLPWVSSSDKGSSFVSDALIVLVETWWYKTSAFSVAVVGIIPSTRGLKNPLYRRKYM